MKPIRVLICEGSAMIRVTLRRIIESDPGIEVIDIARDGAEAIEKSIRQRPNVIILDLNIPVLDGLSALKEIVNLKIAPVLIMVSLYAESASATMEAMDAGAFDFIPKPVETENLEIIGTGIIQKIKQSAASNFYKKMELLRTSRKCDEEERNMKHDIFCAPTPRGVVACSQETGDIDFKAVVIGLSTGGPKSIFHVLPLLPSGLNAVVIVIQHMPPAFISTFTERINSRTSMLCMESQPGMLLEPGKIIVARGGFHFHIMKQNWKEIIIHQTKEPPHLFMPSVDVTMNSVCEVFKHNTVGVLMTGMGQDGADAMVRIRENGGTTIAESEESAIVFGMPMEAIKRGGAEFILPNWAIAPRIIETVKTRVEVYASHH